MATCFACDAAGNQQEMTAPAIQSDVNYRTDGLRVRLWDEEGDKRMVWDSQGSSGYQDLLEENLP